MKIIKLIQNNVALGIAIPIVVFLSLGLLSYFFLNGLVIKGRTTDYQRDVMLRTEELIMTTRAIRLSGPNLVLWDSSKIDFGNRSMFDWRQDVENLQKVLKSEKLELWIRQNLSSSQPLPVLSPVTLDELANILRELKDNQKRELELLKRATSNQFNQFVFWLTGCLILGTILFVLWGRSFWLKLKTSESMEANLRSAIRDVNELYENAPCGYFSINDDFMIEKINNTLVQWLGYVKNEVVDRLHITEVLQSNGEWMQNLIEQLNSNSSADNLEVNVIRKDGTLQPAVLNVNWRNRSGSLGKEIRFTLFDNTERKKSEVEIKNLNKELEAFSYSVSHDLRAPLRSINSYSRILKEDHLDILENCGAMPTLDVIIRNGSKMGQLIDDLLNFSKLNRQVLTKANVGMTSLVESVKEEVINGQADSINFKQHALMDCRGDFNLLQQVWVNLISNAVKYSSKKSNPTIEIGSTDTASEITYYIKDNGAGFDVQYAHKLFGVFQRLHKDSEFPGTGVGLALVKRIVERHNGRVWAESKAGVGSTFYFSLPKEN